MRVEIRERPLRRKPGMNRIILYTYKGHYRTPDGKIKHLESEKALDYELFAKPKTKAEKEHNQKVRDAVEILRAEELLRLANKKHNIPDPKLKNSNFFEYVDLKMERSSNSRKSINLVKAACNHLKDYTKKVKGTERLNFSEITLNHLERFQKYMLQEADSKYNKKIKPNTVKMYMSKITFMLNQAVKEKIIASNPAKDILHIKGEEVIKEWLTIEEIETLKNTPSDHPLLKRAFLFQCFTGLRFIDTENLKYGDIRKNGKGYYISIKQEKTDKYVRIPLSENAISQIDIAEDKEFDQVFGGLSYSGLNNVRLAKWMLEAGIRKKILWHSARHTFGNQLHELGADIATISDLMGDTLNTVVRNYVRISDTTKFNAVRKLDF